MVHFRGVHVEMVSMLSINQILDQIENFETNTVNERQIVMTAAEQNHDPQRMNHFDSRNNTVFFSGSDLFFFNHTNT